MTITHDSMRHTDQYGFNLKPLIDEITLREALPPDYQYNARILTNRKRTVKRCLDKSGFNGVGAVLEEIKGRPAA